MLIIYSLIFLSGFSALIFQIAAQKYLSIYLGSDSLSTTLVLSLFFFFLSLGYWVWGKWGHRFGKNFLVTYGYIELAIGLYYLLAPTLFFFLFDIFSQWPFHFWNALMLSSLFLFIPCFLMGGSLPVCIQAITNQLSESDTTHSMTYALNTIGAFVGSFICGFYLIETFGLRLSLTLAGSINCFICIATLVIKVITKKNYRGYIPKVQEKAKISWLILGLSFLGGFITFAFENIMIRLTALSVGGSTYAYTIIVSSFIFAIGIGAYFYKNLYKEPKHRDLQKLLALTLLFLLSMYWIAPHIPNTLMRFKLLISPAEFNFLFYWLGVFVLFLTLLFFPVVALGLNLPLLFSLHKSKAKHINESVGSLYMYNAFGAMGGALASFGLLYLFNLDVVFKFILFSSLLGLALTSTKTFTIGHILAGVVVIASAIFTLPSWSPRSFTPSRFAHHSGIKTDRQLQLLKKKYSKQDEFNYLFYEDGPNSTVAVVENKKEKNRSLYINGKPDADTKGDKGIRSMTALVPLSLAPSIDDVFIIGLGTGMSTGITTSFSDNKHTRVTEMSEGVIKALPLFEQWNFGLLKKHKNKFQITQGDAYSVLKNDTKKYNVIMSEPSNTWVTGVEKLYTKEFLKLASSKLTKDGVYSQWFPLFLMKESGFLSIIKNFQSVFPEVTLWQLPGYAVIILASKKPLEIDPDKLKLRFDQNPKAYKNIKKTDHLGILSQQLLPPSFPRQLAKKTNFWHSLGFPTLGYSSARAHFSYSLVSLRYILSQYFNAPQKKVSDNFYYWETLPKDKINSNFLKSMHQNLLKTPQYHPLAGLHYLKWWHRNPDNRIFKKDKKLLAQYDYLSNPQPQPLPQLTKKPKAELYVQLWSRYVFLLNTLQPAYYERLLPAIPKTCKESVCFQIKLDLLKQNNFIQTKTALALAKSIDTKRTQNWIENQFAQQIPQSGQ